MRNNVFYRHTEEETAEIMKKYKAAVKDIGETIDKLNADVWKYHIEKSTNYKKTKKMFPKMPVRFLINRAQLWWKGATVTTEWYQEGNTINLRIQRCGLFRDFCGMPFVQTIEIDPTQVIQSPK